MCLSKFLVVARGNRKAWINNFFVHLTLVFDFVPIYELSAKKVIHAIA